MRGLGLRVGRVKVERVYLLSISAHFDHLLGEKSTLVVGVQNIMVCVTQSEVVCYRGLTASISVLAFPRGIVCR